MRAFLLTSALVLACFAGPAVAHEPSIAAPGVKQRPTSSASFDGESRPLPPRVLRRAMLEAAADFQEAGRRADAAGLRRAARLVDGSMTALELDAAWDRWGIDVQALMTEWPNLPDVGPLNETALECFFRWPMCEVERRCAESVGRPCEPTPEDDPPTGGEGGEGSDPDPDRDDDEVEVRGQFDR